MVDRRELHPVFQAKMLGDLAKILEIPIMEIPEVFRRAKPRALKLGIHEDLLAKYPAADQKKLSRWLGGWTGTKQYLARIVYGTNRHGLDADDCGDISDDDRQAARLRMDALFERWKKKQKAGENP